MKIRPEVGGLINPTAVRKVDLPEPLGPRSATTLAMPDPHIGTTQGGDFGIAASVNLGEVLRLNRPCFVHGGTPQDTTSLGLTLAAFHTPRALPKTQIAATIPPS